MHKVDRRNVTEACQAEYQCVRCNTVMLTERRDTALSCMSLAYLLSAGIISGRQQGSVTEHLKLLLGS